MENIHCNFSWYIDVEHLFLSHSCAALSSEDTFLRGKCTAPCVPASMACACMPCEAKEPIRIFLLFALYSPTNYYTLFKTYRLYRVHIHNAPAALDLWHHAAVLRSCVVLFRARKREQAQWRESRQNLRGLSGQNPPVITYIFKKTRPVNYFKKILLHDHILIQVEQ